MLRTTKQIINKNYRFFLPIQHKNCYSTSTDLPDEADVVIIGGGSIGCNTFYQLSRKGVKPVLLERNTITSGTTWHTGGLVWRLRPSDVDIQLLSITTEQLKKLEEETGLDPGYVNNGGLFISRTDERLKEYKRLQTLGSYFGINSEIISSEDAMKLHPLLNPKNFSAALYSPSDGCLDPSMLCTALTKGARDKGGRLIENCVVESIALDDGQHFKKIQAVHTNLGTIRTKNVVNATGVWSRDIARMVGLEIPIVPIKHAYVITESIPLAKGTPNIRDHDASIYYRTQGDTLYVGGYEMNAEMIKEVDKDFAFGLYELNFDIFGVHLKEANGLTPIMERIGVKTNICGPESFTPDHKPLIGEDPRIFGFYHACGLNSAGMMFGPGIATELANEIVHGQSEIPMFNFHISRFTPGMQKNRPWAIERSQEAYAKNYSIVFPHDQPLAGRNFKIDVFHEACVARGAVMEQAQGWERPAYYIKDKTAPVRDYDWYGYYDHVPNSDQRYEKELEKELTFDFSKQHDLIREEALAARTNVVLFNISYFSKMYLTGPHSEKAAEWLFTARTNRPPEKIVYTCALNKDGGTESDLTVIGLDQGVGSLVGPIIKGKAYYLVAGGASGYHTKMHLRREIHKHQLNATITDVTEQLGILSIQGPKSRDLLQTITEYPLTDDKLPFGMSTLIKIDGHTCRIFRISFIGELGYEVHIPTASCIPIFNKIEEVGKNMDMRHAGYRALYSLSCEKGYHLWNVDLRSDDNPVEANLGGICRTNGNYLGKHAVDRLKKEGLKRMRVFVALNDQVRIWGNENIWRNNEIIGFLRRGEYGYFLKSSIGFGFVKHPKNENITKEFLTTGKFEVEVMGKRYPAKLYLESPFDPDNQRLAGCYENQFREQDQFED